MLDVAKYLERIDYHGPRRPDAATLHMIHRAHVAHVPYENIDVYIGAPLRLDAEWLIDKVVNRRRGGSCFELNGALELLLRELGFSVWMVEAAADRARDGDAAWGNHLALLVEVEGERWLVDVGIGVGWCWPLPFREGSHRQGPLVYRIERLDPETWRVHRRPGTPAPSMDVRLAPRQLATYLNRHRWLATSPDSRVSNLLIVQRPFDDHAMLLRALTLTRWGPALGDEVDRRVLATLDEFATVLGEGFGVPLDDLGEERLSRLWKQAHEQHSAWLVERTVAR